MQDNREPQHFVITYINQDGIAKSKTISIGIYSPQHKRNEVSKKNKARIRNEFNKLLKEL